MSETETATIRVKLALVLDGAHNGRESAAADSRDQPADANSAA